MTTFRSNLGHNFFFADTSCNCHASGFLAYVEHLAEWKEMNIDDTGALSEAFTDAGFSHDRVRSAHVAHITYEQSKT